jgi:bifunctional non-homologous end joining protein LigD
MSKGTNKKLTAYRAKRDFSKTSEPSGRQKVAALQQSRFVIQKHAATRLHYDLRLELDGVFKSWAVTKGPSLDPRNKRLAVEVEDHPLDYGDFEGTIPQGEYGGGTVQLWDRGYWNVEGPLPADEALRQGELKFALDGERLKGSWVLVRMRTPSFKGKRASWLLIKHRDAYARDGDSDSLLDEDRSVASGRPMAMIAAGKGRAPRPFIVKGCKTFAAKAVWASSPGKTIAPQGKPRSIKKVAGKSADAGRARRRKAATAMPDFIAPQLCKPHERPPAGPGWGHEIKFDGYRIQMRVENGAVACAHARAWIGLRSFPRSPKQALLFRTASLTARSSHSITTAFRISPRCKRLFRKNIQMISYFLCST